MKTRTTRWAIRMTVMVVALTAVTLPSGAAEPMGTSFIYQGQLRQDGVPLNDTCDFEFLLFTADVDGSQVGASQSFNAVPVANGLFTAELYFGASAFPGDQRFLEVAVQCSGDVSPTTLSPRHSLTATPYASTALKTVGVDGHSLDAQDGIPADAVRVDYSGNVLMEKGGLTVFDDQGHGISLTSDEFSFKEGTSEDPVYDYSSSTDTHEFYTNGNRQMVINAAGNVGIGMSWAQSPSAKLHIGGTAEVDGIMFPDGTLQTTAATGGGDSWALSGNAGTTPGANFVGTTDNQPLELHVDGVRALRIEPTDMSPNLIGGHEQNMVNLDVIGATISGGGMGGAINRVTDEGGAIGGGANNQAGDDAGNTIDASNATVAGGYGNTASGLRSTVSGGRDNTASGINSAVGGGGGNNASDSNSVVSGGGNNNASSNHATVAGGSNNTASGGMSTVGGGEHNSAYGYRTTIPGGSYNEAYGTGSLAAGHRAQAFDSGTFVWSDSTTTDPDFFYSTGANQFLVKASGGVGINTNAPGAALHIGGTAGTDGIMFPDGSLQTTAATGGGGDSLWTESGTDIFFTAGDVGIGTSSPQSTLHVISARSNAITGECLGEETRGYLGHEFAGVFGEGLVPGSIGVYGYATGSTGSGQGVRGEAEGETASGVWGRAFATTGNARGLRGETRSGAGSGVYGENLAASGNAIGVYGKTSSPTGYGGYFEGRGYFSDDLQVGGNIGVGTSSPDYPLEIESGASSLIYAKGTATTSYTVRSETRTTSNGAALYAQAMASSGTATGVIGGAQSPNGVGVFGFNDGDEAPAIGVRGVTMSSTGFGGYFEGRGYFSGRVGIDEESPQAMLHIGGISGTDGIMFPDGTLQTSAAGAGGGVWSASGSDIYYASGNVGIGAAPPGFHTKLVVETDDWYAIDATTTAGSGHAVWGDAAGTDGEAWGIKGTNDGTGGGGVKGRAKRMGVKGEAWSTTTATGTTWGVWGESDSPIGIGVYGLHDSSTGDAPGIYGETQSRTEGTAGVKGEATATGTSGDVTYGVMGISQGDDGIGVYGKAMHTTTNHSTYGGYFEMDSTYGAAVRGSANSSSSIAINYGGLFESNGRNGYGVYAKALGTNAYAGYFLGRGYFSGDVGIGTSSPTRKLDVRGWARVDVLEITGGADLSEQFDVASDGVDVEPGMVVAIDAENPGKLVVANQPYDYTVAGVVSGAGGVKPGMLMGQKGSIADGQHPIALTGRVWTWCDASNGAIKPGDLLTTSSVPGHAMKVTDRTKAQGAMIGKAMTSLSEGKGLVLVLVSLQ